MGRDSKNLARIILKFGSRRMANAVFSALEPEAKAAPTGRSGVGISRRGNAVEISILSRDFSSMRAAVNTYLRLASACQGALEALEGLRGGPGPSLRMARRDRARAPRP
ncbi:MAG: KEOPS complex subunit Pcc1 [Candidatus Bathyarchaeia archaeon]